MSLNLIEFLPHLLHRQVRVEQMALLNPLRRELIVVFESPDVVVWIRAEQEPEQIRVGCRLLGPRTPDLVAKGIRDEVVLRTLEDLVRANAWWRRVGLRRSLAG